MLFKIGVDVGASFGQLRHGMDWNGTLALGHEKRLQGLLARLLGHEGGVGIIPALLMALSNGQVMFGLANPAQPGLTTWLHK